MVLNKLTKNCILNYSLDELKQKISDLGLKPFVAKQICDWVYQKRVVNFADMTNLSNEARTLLENNFTLLPFKKTVSMPSNEGNAIKFIHTLQDGFSLEMVVLKEKNYNTLCVSSQVGCPVDCKFCLTGVMGFKRQLEVSEIVGQVLSAFLSGYPITNLVFMGMGEPLLNFDRVFNAIDILRADYGLNIGKRRIVISTSGHLKCIQRLIDEERYIDLAFSVGCTDPIKRVQLMPVEKTNPFVEVVRKLSEYLKLHNRKLTLEYTLLKGQNDQVQHIKGLINLSKFLNAKINLINLNPHPKIPFTPLSKEELDRIYQDIKSSGAVVTVRYKKGQDITAACGQLGESLS